MKLKLSAIIGLLILSNQSFSEVVVFDAKRDCQKFETTNGVRY